MAAGAPGERYRRLRAAVFSTPGVRGYLGLAAGTLAMMAGLACQPRAASPQDLPRAHSQALQAPVPAQLQVGMQVPVHGPAGSIVGVLQGTQATLVSLRGLPVQPMPTVGTRALFRHRAELRLQGSVVEVTRALALLARDVEPMRLEQVLLSSADSGPAMQATVVLTAVNQEPTWFAL
jgi:hypothetical protein